MKIGMLLKKKILCSMATKYLRQEFKDLDARNLTDEQTDETKLYFTSKTKEQPFKRVDGKIVWSEDDKLSTTYQEQVVEIARLNKNIQKLDKLRYSSKISDYTREVIEKYLMNLKRARQIYALGRDNLSFDREVVDMNEFVQTHMVIRNGHKTFRLVTSKDDEVKRFGHTMIRNHREAMLGETRKRFDKVIDEAKTK